MMMAFTKDRFWHLFYGKKIESIISLEKDKKMLLFEINYSGNTSDNA